MVGQEMVDLAEDKAVEADVSDRAVFVRIEEFPVYASGSACEIREDIAAYLLSWFQTDLQHRSTVLAFPGIGRMTGFFRCQAFDILYAFSALEESGFRLTTLGFDAPLLVTRLEAFSRPRVRIHDFRPCFYPENPHPTEQTYLPPSIREGPLACPC